MTISSRGRRILPNGDNFVLAHDKCNNAKADYLAAEKHLTSWAEQNRLHQEELQSRLQAAALPCDWPASVQIARWVYKKTEKANGQVWFGHLQLVLDEAGEVGHGGCSSSRSVVRLHQTSKPPQWRRNSTHSFKCSSSTP